MNKTNNNLPFIMLPRFIFADLQGGNISFDEYIILVHLFFIANYENGVVKTSCETLAASLPKKYSINRVNQILLSLMQNYYIWFEKQRGKAGKTIEIHNYPFDKDNRKDISHRFKETSTEEKQNLDRTDSELSLGIQNYEKKKQALVESKSFDQEPEPYRTSNTKKEDTKIIDKKTIKEGTEQRPIPVPTFQPQNHEQAVCLRIAKDFNEKDMRFLLSCLNKFGLLEIERCAGIVKEEIEQGNHIENPGAYFNKLIVQQNT